MDNVIQFPDRREQIKYERSAESQARMEEIIEQFDEQFQYLFECLLNACDDFPDDFLVDPVTWGNGYLSIAIGAGVEPEALIGFQQIQALCEEFGFIYTIEHQSDGTMYYEFKPNEEAADE